MQVIPRAVETSQDPRAISALGIMGALLPLCGAMLGGLLGALLANGGWKAGAVAGLSSQIPALPGYLSVVAQALGLGYVADALVYTALYLSYLVLSMWVGANSAGWWHEGHPKGIGDLLMYPNDLGFWATAAFVALALLFLVLAAIVLSNPDAPLSYAAFLGLGSVVLLLTAAREGVRGWLRNCAVILLVMSLGITGLAVLLAAGFASL